MRRSVVVLGVVDVLLLVSAAAAASTSDRDALTDRVTARSWPARVTPTGPWPATLDGSGPRFTMTRVVGAIPDALDEATFRLPEPNQGLQTETANLTLLDGTTWQPKGTFRLEAEGIGLGSSSVRFGLPGPRATTPAWASAGEAKEPRRGGRYRLQPGARPEGQPGPQHEVGERRDPGPARQLPRRLRPPRHPRLLTHAPPPRPVGGPDPGRL